MFYNPQNSDSKQRSLNQSILLEGFERKQTKIRPKSAFLGDHYPARYSDKTRKGLLSDLYALGASVPGPVLTLNSGVTVKLENLKVKGGVNTAGAAGGISNFGSLTLQGSKVSKNTAFAGGGIFNGSAAGPVTGATTTNVFDNTPDNCFPDFATDAYCSVPS